MSQGDENNLDTPTELTTVLGEYVSSSSKEKGASSSALIVLIVMVFVLLGWWLYLYADDADVADTVAFERTAGTGAKDIIFSVNGPIR